MTVRTEWILENRQHDILNNSNLNERPKDREKKPQQTRKGLNLQIKQIVNEITTNKKKVSY